MVRRASKARNWQHIEGKPSGYEYEFSGGMVAVRVWMGDWFQENGPAALIGGSVEATVRRLLAEMEKKP